MDKMKKIEKRLSKLYRLQKRLEKKRKKLNKFAAKNRKNAALVTKKAGKKLTAVKAPVKGKTAARPSKSFLWRFGVSLACSLAATAVVVAVYKALKKSAVQADAEAKELDACTAATEAEGAVTNQDYEKASLEELEEALLRVENQLDEVSQAIDESKK